MEKSLKMLAGKITIAALLGSISFGAVSYASMPGRGFVQPTSLYGSEIYFDVYRNSEKVGYHRVSFKKAGANLSVDVTFMLKINVLLFTAYKYHYQSRSEWHDGLLQQLQVSVDDDGKLFRMEASRLGDSIRVENGSSHYHVPAPILPTDHWNAAVLGDSRVLNTLTGVVNAVHINKLGRTEVTTEAGPVSATHYAYTGDLHTEVWYDDAGRWVKMRFKGKDGSSIDYHCRRCQGTEIKKAKS
ncbi:MAG: DUF6134 family protein [Rhodospirillales bacterium]|nr:DUF6134 family protein [Rhodospirillales bacterium]